MILRENYPLDALNTLGFSVRARYFTEATATAELEEAIRFSGANGLSVVPLGGGSNVVFCGDLDALVIKVGLKGRQIVFNSDGRILVEAAAGENWHDFVRWTLQNSAFGLENLSLIPGTVGAAPIQNIGAYGVEIRDRLHTVRAINTLNGELAEFSPDDCLFGYRDSIFKHPEGGHWLITSVTFSLSDRFVPQLDYQALAEAYAGKAEQSGRAGAESLSDLICDIRRSKLPDPTVIGNVGSFFRNPVVSEEQYRRIKSIHPNAVAYPDTHGWKLAAGWLIDQAGFRGIRRGAVGCWREQALVLVNYGDAQSAELMALAGQICTKIVEMFGVHLQIEPRVYTQTPVDTVIPIRAAH